MHRKVMFKNLFYMPKCAKTVTNFRDDRTLVSANKDTVS